MTNQDRIRVFQENRILAYSDYKDYTARMLEGTVVFNKPSSIQTRRKAGEMKVEFLKADTVSAILHSARHRDRNICALNFADALTPGGLVEQGEITQEESLCRCSNLYESLIKNECITDYYGFNRSLGGCIFSGRLIYSKDVAFFRESLNYSILNKVIKSDVVTCPAPIYNGDNGYYNVIIGRIIGILLAMAKMGVKTAILGAWGCGAFGGDAVTVGHAFRDALSKVNVFDKIYFAVVSTCNDTIDNYSLLQKGFYG